MKDTSLLEKILSKFLSHEQIVALTEEISKGVSVVNGVIDKNEKVKAKKEFVLETFRSVDRMIAQSNKIPATFKLFYDTAKIKIHDLLEPIISGMVMENDFSDLDDIPDVNKTDSFQKPENNERTQGNPNNNQQQNGGEQGSRRRRRRHGRNRNNNHNAETFSETAPVKPEPKPEPVETFHETSLPNEPKQASKPAPKQEPKPEPVQTFHETSLPNESKPKPAKRGRTPKKNDAKPESEPKPETPQTNETPAAKKPARRGRTPRKPKETNE